MHNQKIESTMRTFALFFVFILMYFSDLSSDLRAQGFVFSNGFESPMYLNPAYAGTAGSPQLATHFRRPTSGAGFFHYVAAFDMPVEKLRGGAGLVLSSSILEDVLVETQLNGVYAFHLKVSEELLLSPAINIGFGYNHFNTDNLSFGGGEGKLSSSYLTVGGGLLMRYRNLLAGFSVDHLNTPDVGYGGITNHLPARFTLHGIYEYALHEEVAILPGIIYQSVWEMHHISPSVVLDFMGFRAGVSGIFRRTSNQNLYPNTSGLSFLVGVHLKQLILGYGYTTGTSRKKIPGVAAHEFAITYRFGQPE